MRIRIPASASLLASGVALGATMALHGCLAEAALLGGALQAAVNAPGSQVMPPSAVPIASPSIATGDAQAGPPGNAKPIVDASPPAPLAALVLDGYEVRPLSSRQGKAMEFLPRLKNTGSRPTPMLDGVLACSDPQVEVAGKVSYLPINAGQTRTSDRYRVALPGGFVLTFPADAPKGQAVAFTLTLEDGAGNRTIVQGSITIP